MKIRHIFAFFFISAALYLPASLTTLGAAETAEEEPLAMLIDVKGKVYYSPDGKNWKSVNRNKFLFAGWRVKTDPDGVCKILKHQSDMIEVLASATEIEIHPEGTKILRGNISDTRSARSFSGFLKRKFAKVQKYTMVRRSAGNDVRLRTAAEITLSEDYPDLVWESKGPEYSYQLHVGDQVFTVPGNDDAIVRFRLPESALGKSDYCVNILYKEEVLYAPEERCRLRWLSEEEKKDFYKDLAHLLEIAPANDFLLGTFLEKQGFTVIAMDHYRKFLNQNPDAHEVRPFLLRVLEELELKKMKNEELAQYSARQK